MSRLPASVNLVVSPCRTLHDASPAFSLCSSIHVDNVTTPDDAHVERIEFMVRCFTSLLTFLYVSSSQED